MEKFHILCLLLELCLLTSASSGQTPKAGCRKVLDIVLVLDGSDSISTDNFDKVKSSVEDFTRQLDIGTDKIWLGLVLYSTNLTQTIQLTGNKNEIIQNITQLKHERLGTNTAAGILKMSELLLYGRPNVPKLGVVVTDGQSLEPKLTRSTARAAMDAGIDMYSVGIGDQVDTSELQGLASAPNMSITFDNFDKLTLADIGKEICPTTTTTTTTTITTMPTTTSAPITTLVPTKLINRCKRVLDIVLVFDGSDSINSINFEKIKTCAENFTRQLDIGTDNIWLGLVLYSTNLTDTVQLTGNKNEILQRISQLKHERLGTNTAAAVLKMTKMLLYGRPGVPKMGIVVTDGISLDPVATRASAMAAIGAGIDMYSIGIGDQTDKSELLSLASDPSKALTYDNFDTLSLDSIGKEICPTTTTTSTTTTSTTTTTMPTTTATTTTPSPSTPSTKTTTMPTTTPTPSTPSTTTIPTTTIQTTTTPPTTNPTPTTITTTTTAAPTTTFPTEPTTRSTTHAPIVQSTRSAPKRQPKKDPLCEGCSMVNGAGYSQHPDCDKFIQCHYNMDGDLVGEVQHCLFPTFWSQDLLTCVTYDKSDCPKEMCAAVAGYAKMPETNNCLGYWICEGYTGMAFCCQKGEMYDETSATCVKDQNNECNATCAQDTVRRCELQAVPGNPNLFQQHVGSSIVTKACAPGTVFNETTCECSDYGPMGQLYGVEGCKPELYIPFNTTTGDRSGNELYVGNEFTEVDGGFGLFNGNSRLIVPRFTNLGGVGTLVIKAKYTSDKMNMSAPRAVVSNSDCGNDPSVLIIEDDHMIHFGVRTTTIDYFVSTSVPRRVTEGSTQSQEITYTFDGGFLTGSNGEYSNSIKVNGTIAAVKCALHIGDANDFDGFVGRIDEVKVYLCNPDKP